MSQCGWSEEDGSDGPIPLERLEDLEEGYGDVSDGPDYNGYTAKEREMLEIGGVLGLSLELNDQAISDFMEELDGEDPTGRFDFPGY